MFSKLALLFAFVLRLFLCTTIHAQCVKRDQTEYHCTYNENFTRTPSEIMEDPKTVEVLRIKWPANKEGEERPAINGTLFASLTNLTSLKDLQVFNLRVLNPQEYFAPVAATLKNLTLVNVNLTMEDISKFPVIPNLEYLTLEQNGITKLSFPIINATAPKLRSLRLADNQITDITYINDTVPELESLDLSGSKVTTTGLTFRAALFKNLPKLRHLILTNLSLTEANFSLSSHPALQNLYELNLSGNLYETFPSEYFSNMTQLRILNLSNNPKLVNVTGAFAKTRLDSLDLSNCAVDYSQTPIGNVFRNAQIRVLSISRLPLVQGPGWNTSGFPPIEDLEVFDASGHAVGSNIALRKISKHLVSVRLRKTGLTSIPADFVQFVLGLKNLDLSENSLGNIPDQVLSGLWQRDAPTNLLLLHGNPTLKCSCELARFFSNAVANGSTCYDRNRKILCRDWTGQKQDCPKCVLEGVALRIDELGAYYNSTSECAAPRCPLTTPTPGSDSSALGASLILTTVLLCSFAFNF